MVTTSSTIILVSSTITSLVSTVESTEDTISLVTVSVVVSTFDSSTISEAIVVGVASKACYCIDGTKTWLIIKAPTNPYSLIFFMFISS